MAYIFDPLFLFFQWCYYTILRQKYQHSKNLNIIFSYDVSKLAETIPRIGDRQDFSTSEYCSLIMEANLPTYSLHDFSGIFFSYEQIFF